MIQEKLRIKKTIYCLKHKTTQHSSSSRNKNDFPGDAFFVGLDGGELPQVGLGQRVFEKPETAADAEVVDFGRKENFAGRLQARVEQRHLEILEKTNGSLVLLPNPCALSLLGLNLHG